MENFTLRKLKLTWVISAKGTAKLPEMGIPQGAPSTATIETVKEVEDELEKEFQEQLVQVAAMKEAERVAGIVDDLMETVSKGTIVWNEI